MDFNMLKRKAKRVYEQRGGSKAAKADAQELADIARGKGSLSSKAKQAAEALRDPGAPGDPRATPPGHTGAPGRAGAEPTEPMAPRDRAADEPPERRA